MAPKKAVHKIRGVVQATPSTAPAEISGGPSVSMALPPPQTPSHRVLYADRPLSLRHHFGYSGWMDHNAAFSFRRELPLTRDNSMERTMMIHRAEPSTFRVILTDADFVAPEGHDQIEKPEFFFGDRIEADDDMDCTEDSKMLHQTNDRFLFLPDMKRMYPLSYFQSVSCCRRMGWDLVEERSRVYVGALTHQAVRPLGNDYKVQGLKPGEFHRVGPNQERATPANTFIRRFIAAQGEFPAQEFRTPGWVYSLDDGWWVRMVDFVINELRTPLTLSGLEIPVRATRIGVMQNSYSFFAILEKYNPDTCTFFTPVGELGFALQEMYAVSGLPFGELPYEEFVPSTAELSILRREHPDVYATFWEVMCHFHICVRETGLRSGGVKQASWAEYLFQNLHSKNAAVTRLPVSSSKVVTVQYVNEVLEDIFPPGTNLRVSNTKRRLLSPIRHC